MNTIIIWLAIGGLVGWMASLMMRAASQQAIFLNVVAGVVGAGIGGWFLGPVVGVSAMNHSIFNVQSLLMSFLGAAILVASVNLVRRVAPKW